MSPGVVEVLAPAGIRAQLSVPISAGGQPFAVFNVYSTTRREFTEEERRLMVALAQRAGLAIENARLYEAARGKAALEERQRLARELHDSVSQVLYAIALNAAAAERFLASDPGRLEHLVGDVHRLAEVGLAEMRALIFELRPESLESEGLVAAIEKQVAAVRARYRLAIRATLGQEPDVPLAMKEGVYRVAQEALHNVAKHARAQTVDVALAADAVNLVLRVSDDGQGFDPAQPFPGHLGVQSMRERAVALGGTLEVDSVPGRGTRVCLRVTIGRDAARPPVRLRAGRRRSGPTGPRTGLPASDSGRPAC
jgi:signal transduction histidine kinase